LIDVDLSIGIKQTPRQDVKSNAAQDDKQHNATLRRRNLKKHLFKLKEKGKKDVEG